MVVVAFLQKSFATVVGLPLTVIWYCQFFEMQRHHATKALEIYRRAGLQVVIPHSINAFSDITDPIAIW